MSENVLLSQQAADFQDLRQELLDKAKAKNSFNTVVSSSTGMMMVEFLAGIGTYARFGIERAIQELRRDDAADPISVYKLARTLGMTILRYRPSKTTVELIRADPTGSYSIPAFAEVTVDGSMTFVLDNPVVFADGEASQRVSVQEGTLVEYDHTADGSEFQTIVFGSHFTASNDLLRIMVGSEEWKITADGLWNYGGEDKIVEVSTLPDGSIEAIFGNNQSGQKPTTGETIKFLTYEVSGGKLNSPRTGLKVTLPDYPEVTGTTVARIDRGESIRDIQYYRVNSPRIYAAAKRCVRRTDFALLSTYAGVVDLKAVGEADIAPGDLRWQATVGLVVVTTSPWTAAQKEEFIAWAEEQYTIYGLKMIWLEARELKVRPLVSLVVFKTARLADVEAAVKKRIEDYFAKLFTAGILGTSFYPIDLAAEIKAVTGVKHVVMNEPDDVMPAQYRDYITLDSTYEVNAVYEK